MIRKFIDYFIFNRGTVGFDIDEDEFASGLKYSMSNSYPWKDHNACENFFDGLWKEESIASLREVQHLEKALEYEKIHICYSWAFTLRSIGIMLLLTTVTVTIMHIMIPAIVALVMALMAITGDHVFRRRVSNIRTSLVFMSSLIDILIEEKINEE